MAYEKLYSAVKNAIRRSDLLTALAGIVYGHLLAARGDRRLLVRTRFQLGLKKFSRLLVRNGLPGGLFSRQGDYYLAMDDGLFLYYNFGDRNLTAGDGQSLETAAYEWPTRPESFLLEVLPADATYVDVGANSGYFYALKVAARYPHSRVFAFEPDPKIFFHLGKNIAINRIANITAVPVALADKSGRMAMTADLGASNFLVSATTTAAHVKLTTVETNTLDRYAADNKLERIDAIKVDIEGHEVDFLKGAQQTIERSKPILILELNDSLLRRAGTSLREALDLLQAWGYRCHGIKGSNDVLALPAGKHDLFPSDGDEWLEHLTPI